MSSKWHGRYLDVLGWCNELCRETDRLEQENADLTEHLTAAEKVIKELQEQHLNLVSVREQWKSVAGYYGGRIDILNAKLERIEQAVQS